MKILLLKADVYTEMGRPGGPTKEEIDAPLDMARTLSRDPLPYCSNTHAQYTRTLAHVLSHV